MIKFENTEVMGWEAAIRGARNPMNSHNRSDSYWIEEDGEKRYFVGDNDEDLMLRLAKAGSDHAKYRRMITVYTDITAPLYWWKEADTYKVGTVANSCSTMHKIHAKEFTFDDFSHEHMISTMGESYESMDWLVDTIDILNRYRKLFLDTKDKIYWWQLIQILPASYNQKRTWMANYEVLANIYKSRKGHKLDEWHVFCDWIENLPYSELITCHSDPDIE